MMYLIKLTCLHFADIHVLIYNEGLQFPENTRTDFPSWRELTFYTS